MAATMSLDLRQVKSRDPATSANGYAMTGAPLYISLQRKLPPRRQKKAAVTLEGLVEMQDKLYDKALESGQLSPGVAAAREISVLTGHRIERAEIGSPGEFESMQDDELERVLIERLGALGLSIEVLPENDTQH
jgi:hypothetical protein